MPKSCAECKWNHGGRCEQRNGLFIDPKSEICPRFYDRKTKKRTVFNIAAISPREMAKWMVFQVRMNNGEIGWTFPHHSSVWDYTTREEAYEACAEFLQTEVEG